MNRFKELYSTIVPGMSFNTWIDIERKLMLQERNGHWEIVPNTPEGKYLNGFYSTFPEGIEGTKEECLDKIKDYTI